MKTLLNKRIKRLLDDRYLQEASITRFIFRNRFESNVVLSLNLPGINKKKFAEDFYAEGRQLFRNEILKKFNILDFLHEEFGLMSFYSCIWGISLDAYISKRLVIDLEQISAEGDLFDFDVYNITGYKISRLAIEAKPRKCFLCNNDAVFCSQHQNHNYNDLLQYVKSKHSHLIRRTIR